MHRECLAAGLGQQLFETEFAFCLIFFSFFHFLPSFFYLSSCFTRQCVYQILQQKYAGEMMHDMGGRWYSQLEIAFGWANKIPVYWFTRFLASVLFSPALRPSFHSILFIVQYILVMYITVPTRKGMSQTNWKPNRDISPQVGSPDVTDVEILSPLQVSASGRTSACATSYTNTYAGVLCTVCICEMFR